MVSSISWSFSFRWKLQLQQQLGKYELDMGRNGESNVAQEQVSEGSVESPGPDSVEIQLVWSNLH